MDGDNWLEAEVICCPGCGARLFAVIHSPFCDDYRLYCDRCPKAVEVDFYDPVCKAALDGLPAKRTWEGLMAAIEPLLRPCSCGGQFRGDAPRRCFACNAVVPAAALKDLSPFTDDDPSPERQAAYDRFRAEFIRREQLWAED